MRSVEKEEAHLHCSKRPTEDRTKNTRYNIQHQRGFVLSSTYLAVRSGGAHASRTRVIAVPVPRVLAGVDAGAVLHKLRGAGNGTIATKNSQWARAKQYQLHHNISKGADKRQQTTTRQNAIHHWTGQGQPSLRKRSRVGCGLAYIVPSARQTHGGPESRPLCSSRELPKLAMQASAQR